MIALALLASHMVGDFVLQTRWQAVGKFDEPALRTTHVLTYTVAFLPVVVFAHWLGGVTEGRAVMFLCLLFALHYLTDSRRFRSTLGDWIAWRLHDLEIVQADDPHVAVHTEGGRVMMTGEDEHGDWCAHGKLIQKGDGQSIWVKFDLLDNPWPTLPLAIDQALHLVQLATLGWLLT